MLQADLPQEVLEVLPSEPSQQLQLANSIISFAFTQKVAQVESEAQQLREAVIAKQGTIKTLERRVTNLEVEVQELHAKNKAAVEEGHRLQSEKSALIDTVKRLNRELAKLDNFKRNLLQQIQEDGEPSQLGRSMAAVDLSSERLVADVLTSAVKATPAPTPAIGVTPATSYSKASTGHNTAGRGALYSSSSPPRQYSSQQQSPPRDRHHSQPAAASAGSNSPPAAMDGKEFFRQARARLSYEQFSQFLNAIKDLNAGRLNREETLRFVRDLCGSQHADLYALFEGLLSRHLMAG